jgi:hypothetical protein
MRRSQSQAPPLRSRRPVAAAVPGAIKRLALGAGEGSITAGLATAWHDCSPLRDDFQAGGDAAFAGHWLVASLAPRVRAERRR